MTVTGEVLPAAILTPAALDYGRIQTGQSVSQMVTVQADARLFDSSHLPSLVVSYPFIVCTPEHSEENSRPLAPLPSSGKPARFVTRRYKLTVLPQASLGQITGNVSFVSTLNTASYTQHYGSTVPITGKVDGSLTAVPESVDFGTIPVGTASIRRVTLKLSDPVAVHKLKVFCGFDTWFTAHLLTSDGRVVASSDGANKQDSPQDQSLLPANTVLILEITYTPNKPARDVSRQVFVEVGMGQRLNLPVSAQVTP